MKLATFLKGGEWGAGVIENDEVLVFAEGEVAKGAVRRVLEEGEGGLSELKRRAPDLTRVPLSSVTLQAPIPDARRGIFCVGKNYHEHAHEFHSSGFDSSSGGPSSAVPDNPIFFTKLGSSIIAPGETIPRHLDPTDSVDYEGELAVVIGKGGRGISKNAAYSHVIGYTIINDVTSRTLQRRHNQWLMGKSIDGFCPMGPTIVTSDEIIDVDSMRLVTRVNDEVRQDVRVADLIFDIPALIETLSSVITLEPGDLIATGTPVGVGIGFDPPKFLRKGDIVSINIEPIGTLTNTVS
nr:fumarylacetoacetate hydrolase family protein [uncultured Roseovarius sp.]